MGLLRRHADGLARGNTRAAYQFAIDVDSRMDAIQVALGNLGIRFVDDSGSAPPAPVPSPASFDVEPLDGKFKVLITNPQNILPQSPQIRRQQIANGGNASLAPILHNLQSATDTNFNNSSGVVDYGISSQLSYEIHTPNATLFWRLRSSFDGSNWNDWQLFQDAAVCGPIAVSSGFLRSTSTAPRGVTNNSNNAAVTSTDNGDGTDTIHIDGPGGAGSSSVIFDGQGNQTTFPAGIIGGAAQSTFYQIVWSPSTGFRAFPNVSQYTSSLLDQYFIVSGSFKTCAAGGGGGVDGGGGTSGGGGGVGGGGGRVPDI